LPKVGFFKRIYHIGSFLMLNNFYLVVFDEKRWIRHLCFFVGFSSL
jgi:hypothetical protein